MAESQQPQVDEFVVVKDRMESLFAAIQVETDGVYARGSVGKREITPAANKIDFTTTINSTPFKICTVYVRDHKNFKRGDVVMASPNQKSVAFNLLMEESSYMYSFVSKFDATKGLCDKTDFRKGYEYAMSKQQESNNGVQVEMDKLVSALNDIGKIVSEHVDSKPAQNLPPPNSPASAP